MSVAAVGASLPGASPRMVAWGEEASSQGRCSQQNTPRMDSVIEEPIGSWEKADAPEAEEDRPSRLRSDAELEDFDSEDEEGGEGVVAPANLTDTTMLFEDAAAAFSAPPADPGPKEQPVLSLVSLNSKTAATVDILRGTLSVLPKLPDPSAAARTVRISCGRDAANSIVLKDARVSLHHFTLRVTAAAGGRVVLDLLDQSSNGTWVDGRRVGRGRRVTLAVGDRIIALPAALVGRAGEVGYVLLHDTKGARCAAASPFRERPELPLPLASPPISPRGLKGLPRALEQDLRCGICTDVLHRCLTLVPCGHNFCATCLAKWRRRSTLCPGCREPVRQAVQNWDVDRVAETFLRAHPKAARSAEELAALDRAAWEPESAAHLRWLLRDPSQYDCPPPESRLRPHNLATPQRQGTRQPQTQHRGASARQTRVQGPAQGQTPRLVEGHQQRPRSAEASPWQDDRTQSSACVIS